MVTAQVGAVNQVCGRAGPHLAPFFGTSVTTDLIHGAYLGTPGGYLGSYFKP